MTIQERERLLERWNCEFVHQELNRRRFRPTTINRADAEFRRFMTLVLNEPGPLAVLDWQVDEFWHTFILFTPQYEEFCDVVMGFFVHHQPRTPNTPVPVQAIPNYLAAYKRRFGKPFRSRIRGLARIASKELDEQVNLLVLDKYRWSGWPGRS